jgi:hypothetical protein
VSDYIIPTRVEVLQPGFQHERQEFACNEFKAATCAIASRLADAEISAGSSVPCCHFTGMGSWGVASTLPESMSAAAGLRGHCIDRTDHTSTLVPVVASMANGEESEGSEVWRETF